MAELTTGSITPPPDSTDLLVTMQHKSDTALNWRDSTVYVLVVANFGEACC